MKNADTPPFRFSAEMPPAYILGSERESVKCPIWRRLERLRLAAEQRFARQPLFSEPQIQRWRPVWWGRTFYARSRNWKESSHPIDSSWVGSPARLIAGTLGGTCLLYTSDAADDLLCVD